MNSKEDAQSSERFAFDVQWFAGEDPPPIEFDIEEEEPEVVILEDGEEPPKDEEEEPEEADAVRSAQASSPVPPVPPTPTIGLDAFNAGMEKLANTLAARQQPTVAVPEIDPELAAEIKEGLFDDERQAKVLKKAVTAFAKETNAQALAATVNLERRIMRTDPKDGEIFQQYEKEMEDLIRTKYPNFASTPGIWDHVFKEVYATHIEEIATAKAEKIAAAKAGEAEKALPPKTSGASFAVHTEGRGSVSRSSPGKKKVFATRADEAAADALGVPVEEYLKRRGRR